MMSAWQPPFGVDDGARTAAGAAAGEDGDAVSGPRGGGDGRRRKSWTRSAEEKKQKKQQARRFNEDAIIEEYGSGSGTAHECARSAAAALEARRGRGGCEEPRRRARYPRAV